MNLSTRYQPSTRIEHYELEGLLTRLEREISERGEVGDYSTPYFVGAYVAMSLVHDYDYIKNQEDFVALFIETLTRLEGEDDPTREAGASTRESAPASERQQEPAF